MKGRREERELRNVPTIKIGTWNIKTLLRPGKFEEVTEKLKTMALTLTLWDYKRLGDREKGL